MHFTPTIIPLSYQFYACLALVSIFGAISAFALTLLAVYGIGGMELVFSVGFVCFFGLVRLLLPSCWLRPTSDQYDPNLWEDKLTENLAVETFALQENDERMSSSSCCPICLYSFHPIDKISLPVTCQHAYHTDCLNMWLQKSQTCPYCRQDLTRKENDELQDSKIRKNGCWGVFEGILESMCL
ncbi:ring finger domain containing protein [Nitzschia inconspicua]|uniref:Ring finger domain containing protein n=1 Tax=Nitzschia inconspicua TaxID=303405 RepID=A0A9K3LRU9_9STRA|nr:ring finger domain containing protein [Nitzschia inconspicua]